ncbi:MAG: hypothetical protein HQK87_08135 [Nitrospinae bacterium]|nr:hypothetical protein [Nitrospinota bacterium]
MPIGLGGFEGTGADEAIRACIDAAVGDIVNHTPQTYYRIADGPSGAPTQVAVGQLVQSTPIDIGPAASADGIKGPSNRVVSDQKGYLDLLLKLKANPSSAPEVDFSRQRVAAFFAGDKGSADWRIGVRKMTRSGKGLSVTVGQEQLPQPGTGTQWPFVVVVIDAPLGISEVNWE